MSVLLAALALAWPSLAPATWRPVETALARIPAAANGNVLERAKACHLHLRKSESWAGPSRYALPNAKPGDTVIDLYFDAPRTHWFVPVGQPQEDEDLQARWILRGGHAIPDTDWATMLQTKRPPLGPKGGLNC